jgi:hypothetical protein
MKNMLRNPDTIVFWCIVAAWLVAQVLGIR